MKKNTCILFITFLCVLPLLCARADDSVKKSRLSIVPFQDTRSGALNFEISGILQRELSGYAFIEIVPLDADYTELYDMEPSYVWTGMEDGKKEGGIFWNINRVIVEEVRAGKDAAYSVFGNKTSEGEKWNLAVYLTGPSYSEPVFSVSREGTGEKELVERLGEISREIAEWLKTDWVLGEAEEDIRRFMGHMLSYAEVLRKMEKNVGAHPESVPLRALLLDLYLKEREEYRDKVLEEGLTIVNLINPSDDRDIRYLLSLNLDPFAAAAEVFEERKDWRNAIELRNRALKIFPYKSGSHREGLGKDHYFFGEMYEKQGEHSKAGEHYYRAMEFMTASSEYRNEVLKGLSRLRKE